MTLGMVGVLLPVSIRRKARGRNRSVGAAFLTTALGFEQGWLVSSFSSIDLWRKTEAPAILT